MDTPKSRFIKSRSRLKLKRKSGKWENKEVDANDLIFTGIDEGEKVQFIPITDSTRRYVGIQFGLMDEDFNDMPNYVFGGYGIGIKPPKQVFTVSADGKLFLQGCVLHIKRYGRKTFQSSPEYL